MVLGEGYILSKIGKKIQSYSVAEITYWSGQFQVKNFQEYIPFKTKLKSPFSWEESTAFVLIKMKSGNSP